MQIAYRALRSRRKFGKMPKFKSEVGDVLDSEVKPELIKRFKRVTANWETKVDFQGRKKVGGDTIQVNIFPSGENKKIWLFVSGGTKGPYAIRPVRAPFLVFIGGGTYKPKTLPVGKFGGPGVTIGGSLVRSKGVMHPGIKAREFEKVIAADYKREFSRVMENALRRIIRRL